MTAAKQLSTVTNHRAADTICRHALDVDDARDLMEMCGVVEPGGHEILPDETGGIHIPTVGKGPGANTDDPPPPAPEPAEPRARNVTTPAGLRVLPPIQAPRRPLPTPARTKEPEPMTAVLDDAGQHADPAQPAGTYIAAIRADEMFVDDSYQRPLDKPRARRMADAFDPTHRGLSPADEARLFHELDAATTRLTSWDRWHARRGSGDPMVAQIEDLLADVGLKAQPGQTDGNVGCVGSLEKLAELGGRPLLHSTLTVLLAAYGRDWNGYYAPLVSGVGLLLHYYGGDVDPDRLIEALGRSTPQQLKAQAAGLRELMPGSMPRLVAQVLVNRVNSSRGGRKLRDVRDQMPAGAIAPKAERP